MLNVHFSLLPRWRGAAPVERAILAGDDETGVSIMTLDADLDTGPVHLERACRDRRQDPRDAAWTNSRQLGARALDRGPRRRPDSLAHPRAQEGEVTYADEVDEGGLPSRALDVDRAALANRSARVRPSRSSSGRRLLVERADALRRRGCRAPARSRCATRASCWGPRRAAIVLERVRPESAKSMSATAWWTGARLDHDSGHMDVRKPRHE